jgi:hypothetical protein
MLQESTASFVAIIGTSLFYYALPSMMHESQKSDFLQTVPANLHEFVSHVGKSVMVDLFKDSPASNMCKDSHIVP